MRENHWRALLWAKPRSVRRSASPPRHSPCNLVKLDQGTVVLDIPNIQFLIGVKTLLNLLICKATGDDALANLCQPTRESTGTLEQYLAVRRHAQQTESL